MRVLKENNGLKVHVVAGTYVVLFGFDLPEADCEGLLGFSIQRTDHTENEAYFLSAPKAFAETDPGFPSGSLYSTRDHPIQSFQWADYSTKPGCAPASGLEDSSGDAIAGGGGFRHDPVPPGEPPGIAFQRKGISEGCGSPAPL
jgi:hypothetical protein